MSGYCLEADVALAGSSVMSAKLVDYNKDGTADTGVLQWHIDTASYLIRSKAIEVRSDYKDLATLAVSTFVPATSAYQGIRRMAAWLTFDLARGAYRVNSDGVLPTHPVIAWAERVGRGLDNLT